MPHANPEEKHVFSFSVNSLIFCDLQYETFQNQNIHCDRPKTNKSIITTKNFSVEVVPLEFVFTDEILRFLSMIIFKF